MSRFSAPLTLAAACLALLPAAVLPAAARPVLMQSPPPPLAAGTHAPAFSVKTTTGKTLTLKSLRGKVVLMDYWATWCGPCRMATPTLQSLHKRFGRKGLAVVGMSVDDARSVSRVKPFMKAFHATYTITTSPDANQKAAYAYKADLLPSQYLIDKKGIVRWSQAGYSLHEKAMLSKMIKKLLAEKG